MSNISYYTEEGLKKLKEELNHLKDVERPKASNAIAEARDKGDLSENAEYDAAKEAQGMLEMRISKLEERLANARVIDESQLDNSKVLVLSKVKIRNKSNGMTNAQQSILYSYPSIIHEHDYMASPQKMNEYNHKDYMETH